MDKELLGPIHYRYENEQQYSSSDLSLGGEEIICIRYYVIKETPKGYWICSVPEFPNIYKKRWVSKNSERRYAYPNKADAFRSFKIRKRRQLEHLNRQLDRCLLAIDLIQGKKYTDLELQLKYRTE